MKPHKFAEIFPLMNSKEFTELQKDIKENGLLDPIILYEGKILDGRNRFHACGITGVKPRFETYKGNNPLQYVMSVNLKRRHLNDSQLAFVGRKYLEHFKFEAKKRHGGHHKDGAIKELVPELKATEGQARDRAGKVVGVSGRYIDVAEEVAKKKPELEEPIMQGKLNLKAAHRQIKIEEQKEEIKKLKEKTGEYDVIVIDPPWKVDFDYQPNHYMGRVANPYPEMDISQIKKIKLPAKENSILWLWTTHSQIWSAIEIMEHWGFEYKAILVWDKEKMGVGKWLRKQCEFCLLGIKGKPLWTATNIRDIIREPRTSHSTKPESFYQMVEKNCVGKKLEYFARKKRKGWDSYGDEV